MTTLEITDLPIAEVRPHPQNVRRELRGIDELADSIKAEGLHQPIVVAPDADHYVVVLGNSRHAACEQLGWDTIPCIVRSDLNTEEKVLSAMLAENCARNDLTVTEEGDAFQRLLDLDLSATAVGKRAGRSRKQVADRVTIASQSERIRRAVDDKQLTLSNALALAEFTDDHEMHARIEGAIGTPRFEYELERAAAIRRHTKVGEDLRAEAVGLGFVEATEKDLSALNEPVGGYRLERIWGPGTPDSEDPAQVRFTLIGQNLEHWAPSIRWYRLVPVVTEATDESRPSVAAPAPLTDAERAESEAAEARVEVARAEHQERNTAAARRRKHLNELWERDLGYSATSWTKTTTSLLRTAVLAGASGETYMESVLELGIVIDPDSPDLDADDPRLNPDIWSAQQLQFAIWWLMWAVGYEYEVSNMHPSHWARCSAGYLEMLRDHLDYELSDIEEALLDTYYASADGRGD